MHFRYRGVRLNANLGRLFVSQWISSLGDYVLTIALALTVYQITRSALSVAVVYAVSVLPALFGLVLAPLIDRFPLKRLLIVSDLTRAALIAVVPPLAARNVAFLYVVMFVVTLLGVVFQSARMTLLPDAAGGADLTQANSLDSAMQLAGAVIGLALGGSLAALGYRLVFWVDAATFLLSAAFLWRLGVGLRPRLEAKIQWRRFGRDLADGYVYIARNAVLAYNIYGNMILNFAVGIFNSMLVVYCYRRLHSGTFGYTLLSVVEMGGLFFAGIYVALVARTSARGRMLFTGNLGIGIAVAALALATNVYVAAVVIFFAGAANLVANSVSQAMLMETAPVAQRAKVMNARITLGRPLNTLGALFAGLLVDGGLGVELVIALGGAAIAAYALAALAVPAVIAYEVTPPADEAPLHA